jgi:hypothetical protein
MAPAASTTDVCPSRPAHGALVVRLVHVTPAANVRATGLWRRPAKTHVPLLAELQIPPVAAEPRECPHKRRSVRTHTNTRARAPAKMQTDENARTHAQRHVPTHRGTRTKTHMHTHTDENPHARTDEHEHTPDTAKDAALRPCALRRRHTHTHTHTHTNPHTHRLRQTDKHKYTPTHARARTPNRTRAQAVARARAHTCRETCMRYKMNRYPA